MVFGFCFCLRGPQEMSMGENSRGYSSFGEASETIPAETADQRADISAPVALGVSSDADVESAEKIWGLGDHVLKVSKAQLAITIQVSFLDDFVTYKHYLILIQL